MCSGTSPLRFAQDMLLHCNAMATPRILPFPLIPPLWDHDTSGASCTSGLTLITTVTSLAVPGHGQTNSYPSATYTSSAYGDQEHRDSQLFWIAQPVSRYYSASPLGSKGERVYSLSASSCAGMDVDRPNLHWGTHMCGA